MRSTPFEAGLAQAYCDQEDDLADISNMATLLQLISSSTIERVGENFMTQPLYEACPGYRDKFRIFVLTAEETDALYYALNDVCFRAHSLWEKYLRRHKEARERCA